MKPLRIRQWMFVGMLIVLVIPRLFYEIPSFLDHNIFERNLQLQQQTALATTLREVTAGVSRWKDTDWQADLREKAFQSHLGVLLLDSSDHEIFRSMSSGSEKNPDRQAVVMEGSQLMGSVLLFVPNKGSVLASLFAVVAAACAILFIGYQMGRVVVKPLEAMSAAARRIAGGDLEFELPRSTVAEVADVRAAFQTMGNGLQESLTRQSKLEEERRFFISAIAHDLRTPLFVMRGFLMRLKRGLADNPEKAMKYITICYQKAEHLERLVSDLFSYTKLEYAEQTIHQEQVDFNSLLSETLNDFRSIAQEKDVVILYESPNERCMLQGDAHLLRRAVGNLIDNALRYTPPTGRIEIKCQKENTRITFTVEDTGPGISDLALPHIFEPFYHGDASRNPQNASTGLGLTITQRILRLHQGDLTVQN
ncbi:MAG: histidine kinase, partial [Bacilli bacterium]|nr:histidine kinase [Bacilli bacterium]